MAPPKFSDLGKSVDDLLGNDYCFDRKFKLKTRSVTGFELTTEGTLKSSTAVAAKLTGKFSLTPNITVNKLGVAQDGKLFADITYDLKQYLQGLTMSTIVEDDLNRTSAKNGGVSIGELGALYKHSAFTFDTKLDALKSTLTESVAVVVPNFEKLVFGAEALLNITSKANKFEDVVKNLSCGCELREKDMALTVMAKGLGKTVANSKLEVSVQHVVNKGAEVVAKFTNDFASGQKLLSFGGIYVLDPLTKLQTKVDSTGFVSANLHLTLNPNVKLIASSQVDAKNLGSDAHKFGLQFLLA